MLEDLRDYGIVYQRKVRILAEQTCTHVGCVANDCNIETLQKILPNQTSHHTNIWEISFSCCYC